MKKTLLVFLALLFVLMFLPGKTQALSNLTVTVNPSLRDSLAEYDVSFVTGADLAGGKDDIIIQFPEGTKLPCSCPHNWHLDYFSINGNKPSRAGKVTDIPNAMYLQIPGGITIKSGETVNVVIKPYSNIWNPSNPGKYQLTLWTTKEGKVKSNFYEITSTHLTDLSVSVNPDTAGLIASYKISFTTGEKGGLFNGQNVYLEFPDGTTFPDKINKSGILINGEIPKTVKFEDNVLILTLSHSINKNRKCTLEINGSFGIKNPVNGGTKTLYMWTDNEPEKVKADFLIKAQNTVSTLISTVPAAPDGMNGFFKTSPVVTLRAETNTSNETATFYKIDSGEYKEYADQVTMPEGIHTLYYYSTAGELKENVQSRVFKVDTMAPAISVDFPDKNPFYTGDKTINLHGKVSEEGQLIVSGKAVLLKKDLSFSTVLNLVPGKNIVKISFSDIAGNTASREIEIIFDTTVPQLSIVSPIDWQEVSTKTIKVKGTVSPENTDVYVNGEKIDVSEKGDFDYSFVPNSNGNLVPVKVKAIYPYSKKSVEKVITVVYKPNLPEVLLTVNSNSVLVNGNKKQMDVAPFIDVHSSRTLVPVRFVVEFLGGTVQWDAATRTVTIIANDKTIKITIGSKTAYVNGEPFELDQPAIIKGNRTFVPLRFVSEALGFSVKWNGKTKTITIKP
jgi:hypothetical protein